MIEVEQLRKSYGDLAAVDGVSFRVGPGEIFGLLGPNGAGKTTTIGCICGLLKPNGGRVRVMGHDVQREGAAARRVMGLVPQEIALYEDLSAEENLAYWGGAYGLRGAELRRRIRQALEIIGLEDRAREPVKSFSGGMKRRLNFACGLLHRPRVLLLDEPAVGVDPQSRVRLLELIRAEARSGVSVLYTTHYMEEAESLCDRLAIIDRGRIAAQGTLDELRAMLAERDLLRLSGTFPLDAVRSVLVFEDGLEILQAETSLLVLALVEAPRRLPAILAALSAAGAHIRETALTRPGLESLFLKLTGRELRE